MISDSELIDEMNDRTTVRMQPDPTPPNTIGERAIFHIDRLDAAPGWSEGWYPFRYVQDYHYRDRDRTTLQVWRCGDQLFASRIGEYEPLRWIGRDLEHMPHWRDIFTPRTAEQFYDDLVARRVDCDRFRNEIDWRNWCAIHADEIVKMREDNHRRQMRKIEIAELAG